MKEEFVEIRRELENIYKRYGTQGETGRPFFLLYIQRLNEFDFSELIACTIKHFPQSFNVALILSLPELWKGYDVESWFSLIKKATPRSNPIVTGLDNGEFSDILFLIKYIRINIVAWYLEQADIPKADKKYMLQFCLRQGSKLFMDEIDMEDLDGEFFVGVEDLNNLRVEFLHKDISQLQDDFGDFIEFVENNIKHFD